MLVKQKYTFLQNAQNVFKNIQKNPPNAPPKVSVFPPVPKDDLHQTVLDVVCGRTNIRN